MTVVNDRQARLQQLTPRVPEPCPSGTTPSQGRYRCSKVGWARSICSWTENVSSCCSKATAGAQRRSPPHRHWLRARATARPRESDPASPRSADRRRRPPNAATNSPKRLIFPQIGKQPALDGIAGKRRHDGRDRPRAILRLHLGDRRGGHGRDPIRAGTCVAADFDSSAAHVRASSACTPKQLSSSLVSDPSPGCARDQKNVPTSGAPLLASQCASWGVRRSLGHERKSHPRHGALAPFRIRPVSSATAAGEAARPRPRGDAA